MFIQKVNLWPSFWPVTRSWTLYFCLSEDTADLDRFLDAIWFSSVQSLSRVWLCNPMTAACQASLSITNSQSLLKLMSIELVMPSSHLIPCYLVRINVIPLTAGFSLADWVPWHRCWPCAGATQCSWVNSSSGCCGRLPSCHSLLLGLRSSLGSDKESTCNAGDVETWFYPWVRKTPWRSKWWSTPVFLPGKIPWTEEPGALQSMGLQKSWTWLTDWA